MFTVKTVLATVSVALGIGFLVQIGESGPDEVRAPVRTTVPRPVTAVTNTQTSSVFGVPTNSYALVDHLSDVQLVAFVRQNNSEEVPPEMGRISAVPGIEDPCEVRLSAVAMPAAMATLTINAPCHKNADFVIAHETLRFSGRTESTGRVEIVTPVLVVDAKFEILFENVEVARTAIYAANVSHFDRTILQWRGAEHLQLHVLESGAGIGQSGHVWTGSSHTPEQAILGRHGFVSSHGTRDAGIPFQAEVYSFPARFGQEAVAVSMPVGLMVTDQSCDRMIDLQVIQVASGQIRAPTEVSIKLPSCDSVGDFVMLPGAVMP
jgi:hypothetical protein